MNWYDQGRSQGENTSRTGGEVRQDVIGQADDNQAWIDGVLDGVMAAGGRICAIRMDRVGTLFRQQLVPVVIVQAAD